MASEDAETRAALATSDSDTRADLEAALLQRTAAKTAAKPPSHATLLGKLAAFEKAIPRAFMTEEDRRKEQYKCLGTEELVALYTSPELEDLSGFEKLERVHQIAPPAITYDASQPITTLMRFTGTGLELALHRPDFWFLFIFHILLSVTYYRLGYSVSGGTPTAPGWPPVNTNLVAIPGGLMTFVLVFYLNQTFSRYLSQHHHITGTCGLLGEFVLLLRVHLGDHLFPRARIVRHQLCKLANALHILAYASLPTNREAKVNEWAWWFLVDNKLLTQVQVEQLRPLQSVGSGNMVYKEVILWASRGVWAQVSKGHIESRAASLFTYKLWEVRAHLDALFTFVSGPVPFAYYHLLNFVLIVYLFILSYVFVFVAPYWSIPGFFLILVGLLGIRELGNSMSNPLGNDKMDIAVFEDAYKFLKESTLLINRGASYADELQEMKPAENTHQDSLYAGSNGGLQEDHEELLLSYQ